MDPIKLDIKTLIALGGLLLAAGGFYYTTELRLTKLEDEIQSVDQKLTKLSRKVNRKQGNKTQ